MEYDTLRRVHLLLNVPVLSTLFDRLGESISEGTCQWDFRLITSIMNKLTSQFLF